ncbi:MAG: hypothetical protein K2G24_01785, partial [Muribaculaceae bacterium]|nr:hypothetical protein [Muribaculaceae bacterium]
KPKLRQPQPLQKKPKLPPPNNDNGLMAFVRLTDVQPKGCVSLQLTHPFLFLSNIFIPLNRNEISGI